MALSSNPQPAIAFKPSADRPLLVGMLALPKMTQLDFTGPFEVFARMPHTKVHVLWKTIGLVETDRGLCILADTALADCPPLDIVFVPGGPGQALVMDDTEVLDFLRSQSAQARYVTSVCTGALVLGAAGLLNGYRATTHWAALPLLSAYGAKPIADRVVIDGNRVTGGGVTAGIDFGLRLAAEIFGLDTAQSIQLQIEYDPQPPFKAGSPGSAPASVVAAIKERMRPLIEQREADARRHAAALAGNGQRVSGTRAGN
jgi:cyclohexyl-isocyanide hydratase